VNVADFEYVLPPHLIAQAPAAERDSARLLVLDRESGALRHEVFSALPGLLRPGDLLVVNDTRVVPARLVGSKASGGRVELLLVRRLDEEGRTWGCLMKASRQPAPGSRLTFGDGLDAEVLASDEEGRRVRFTSEDGEVGERLQRAGRAPLPPYIRRDDGGPREPDLSRYQTVFAREPGAIAAPTAGLHFTPALLDALARRGVERSELTLHVGTGTFLPVTAARVEDHRMHGERVALGEGVARAVDDCRRRGGRVVAVGTTVVRALESCAAAGGRVTPFRGVCDRFIYPGFRFRVVDALITNFHLPRSTLLMLVSAFAGRERVLEAYEEAKRRGYRFYSYGDAMLVESGT
jgi:S-adenosylmethionine:tRNA ribosyltransferase-isomerase